MNTLKRRIAVFDIPTYCAVTTSLLVHIFSLHSVYARLLNASHFLPRNSVNSAEKRSRKIEIERIGTFIKYQIRRISINSLPQQRSKVSWHLLERCSNVSLHLLYYPNRQRKIQFQEFHLVDYILHFFRKTIITMLTTYHSIQTTKHIQINERKITHIPDKHLKVFILLSDMSTQTTHTLYSQLRGIFHTNNIHIRICFFPPFSYVYPHSARTNEMKANEH